MNWDDYNSRQDEIIRLQTKVIREMAGKNLDRLGEDLWGPNTPVEKAIEHIVERGAKLTHHPK